ncbi:MAG TPA: phosphomannose isomerase type II C-terminal cupin domain [Candidatus Paceibacterota bacterium]|nr:phosphomannose isomerase type II C-terminal cupin domain [Candidatus Paceibacterota bacterium]
MKTLTVERPWGKFEQFTQNEMTTVKIISINRNSSLSLQYHNNREEFWRILSGHPEITIGENTVGAQPGDEFNVKKLEKHRIATKNDAVQILEIAFGDFAENDIIRIEDKYGRA